MINQTRLRFKPTPPVKGWAVTGNACNASNEQARSDNRAVKESWESARVRATAAWVGQFRESCIAGSNYRGFYEKMVVKGL